MPRRAAASFNEDYVAAAAPHESLFCWATARPILVPLFVVGDLSCWQPFIRPGIMLMRKELTDVCHRISGACQGRCDRDTKRVSLSIHRVGAGHYLGLAASRSDGY